MKVKVKKSVVKRFEITLSEKIFNKLLSMIGFFFTFTTEIKIICLSKLETLLKFLYLLFEGIVCKFIGLSEFIIYKRNY